MHTPGGLFAVRLQVGHDYFGCEHVRTIMLNSLFGGPVMYVCSLENPKKPARICVVGVKRLMCAVGVTKHACA